MFNNIIGKNKELGRFLFCERYTLPPVKNAMYIAEGQELKRGAVVDVNGVLVGTNSLMPYAVLEFDCDTRDGGKEASVFLMGEFNYDKLTFAEGLSKDDMDNIVYNGNSVGIVIKPYEYDEGFNPIMAPAGTSQSNPLMTAADTERMIDAMKPIDAMTLRFEFSKKDYNPTTAGVGSAGTWTKVDSPTLNVWDWTNEAKDWHESFKGAFPDADNEVRVIAAGDTSEVTNIDEMFSGAYTGNTSSSSYTPISRNNIVSCVPFNVGSCRTIKRLFILTSLKEVVNFDYSGKDGVLSLYYDTPIDTAIVDYCNASGYFNMNFAKCTRLKYLKITGLDNVTEFTSNIAGTGNYEMHVEKLELDSMPKCTDISTMAQKNNDLKSVTLDLPITTIIQGAFSSCYELEEVNFIRLGNVTNAYAAFATCKKLKHLPNINLHSATNIGSFAKNCLQVTEIPDYDVSSVTRCDSSFNGCINARYGILEMYNKLLARGASITNHTDCFKDCGIDTPEGRYALSQIPQSWGGLAEE